MAIWGGSLLKGQFTGAAAAAAASSAATPFAYRALLGVDGTRAASCDEGLISSEDLLMGVRTASLNGITKGYSIELKPLFSALEMTSLAWTTIHSFASNYSDVLLRILQDAKRREDERRDAERGDDERGVDERGDAERGDDERGDDERGDDERGDDERGDHERGDHERRDVDLILPFWNSVNQILRETTVVTTRRVLERFVVHHCSQRTAWKLLKDLPESALRKSKRGMPFYTYTFCVARTTIKGNFLGVAASCVVLVGIECYRFVRDIVNSENEGENVHKRVRGLGRRVCGVTVKYVATLVFSSIAAGIGAALFGPTTGQSYGYYLGEFVGPSIVTSFIAHLPYLEL